MDLPTFNSLPFLERADEVTTRGLFLERRQRGKYYLQLYQLDDFFVITKIELGSYNLLTVDGYGNIPDFWRMLKD